MTTLKTLADTVARKTWGFVPNRDVKPVHFANGFFRAICGQTGSPSLLAKATGNFRNGGSKVTTEQLLTDMQARYEAKSSPNPVEQAILLRTALDLVLDQDGAAYPSNFSATLTHLLHTSSDPSDQRTGRFLADVLLAAEDISAVETLRRSLTSGTDNVYFLTLPLLKQPEGDDNLPTPSDQAIAAWVPASPILQNIQQAFATITQYEPLFEKTMFLQRVVTLGSFSIFLHLISRAPRDPAVASPQIPILLCTRESADILREASRATLVRGRQQLERAFEEQLTQELRARSEDKLSAGAYHDLLRSWLPNLDQRSRAGKKETAIWEQFQEDYAGFQLGEPDPTQAFVSAAVQAAFKASGEGKPEDFRIFLGRGAGLVFPREGGRGKKYYLPAPQFLDTLVVALLQPTEEIATEEFWDRAWQQFGIVVGARSSQDADRLVQHGIRQISPSQLAHNARSIQAELMRMGHVREYADGIAIIRAGGISNE